MSDDQRHDDEYRDDPWRGPDPTSDPTSPIEHEPTGVVPQGEQPPAPPPPPGPYAGHDAAASDQQPHGDDAGTPSAPGGAEQYGHSGGAHPAGYGQGYDPSGYGPSSYGQGGYGQGYDPSGGHGQGSDPGQGGHGQGYGAAGQYAQGYGAVGDYGQGGYGTGGYGYGAAPPPPPAQPGQPYGYGYGSGYAPTQQNTSALVLTILSALSLAFCAGLLLIPSLVLGIMGLARNSQDPADARRKTRLGWILFAIGWGLEILVVVGLVIAFAVAGAGGYTDYSNTY